jgi:hypothetical protein
MSSQVAHPTSTYRFRINDKKESKISILMIYITTDEQEFILAADIRRQFADSIFSRATCPGKTHLPFR